MTAAEQLQETRKLRKAMETAVDRLDRNDYLVKKARTLSHVLAAAVAVLVVVVGGLAYLAVQNRQNAVTSCENANESRIAVLEGWHFILGWELVDKGNNPAETTMSEMILPWFDKVYAQRDCTDLAKKYPIPPVPTIPPQ